MFFVPVALTFLPAGAWASECATLTPEVSGQLAAYVSERYEFAPDITVQDDGLVGGTCFRRVNFRSASPARTVVLYLSPDQRFLTTELLDSTTHPASERRRSANAAQTLLLENSAPVRGPDSAPVTIVEFSDFQCPFCKAFARFLTELGPDGRDVRVVFKQLPLPIHTWARKAALASICAEFQGSEAFWRMHDYLFSNQESLTENNFRDEIAGFARTGGLDTFKFSGCMDRGDAERVLERDEAMAQLYRVDATPAVFINGRRTIGFKNADELRAAIYQARIAFAYGGGEPQAARKPGGKKD